MNISEVLGVKPERRMTGTYKHPRVTAIFLLLGLPHVLPGLKTLPPCQAKMVTCLRCSQIIQPMSKSERVYSAFQSRDEGGVKKQASCTTRMNALCSGVHYNTLC